jgi:DNA modification methylase
LTKELIGSLELNRIYQMDCLEGMRLMPDKSVDLVIADPPYGVNYQSNFRKEKFNKITDDDIFNTGWIYEAHRTLKDGAAIYCYTRWDVYHEWRQALINAGFKIKNVIIWYKKGGGLGDLKGAYIFNHEFIIYAVKGRHILNGKRTNDVWEIAKDAPTEYVHPTQKPVELALKIIGKSSANEGDVVLIPFVGSGNDCIASVRTNRKFIRFEREPEYIEIANKRLDNEVGD